MAAGSISEMSACPVCGRPGRLTAEHVWPQWLRRYPTHEVVRDIARPAPRTRFERLGVEVTSEGRVEFPVLGEQTDLLASDVTVKVCGTCNNGWMSKLEGQAIPVFERLLPPTATTLSEDEVVTLSTWAAKTAFIYSLTFARHHQCLGQALFASLRDGQVPENVRIWIARSDALEAQVALDYFPALMTAGVATLAEVTGRATAASAFIGAHGLVFIVHWTSDPSFPLEGLDLRDSWNGWTLLWPTGGPVRLRPRLLHAVELLHGVTAMESMLQHLKYEVRGKSERDLARGRRWRPRRRAVVRLLVTPVLLVLRPLAAALNRLIARRALRERWF